MYKRYCEKAAILAGLDKNRQSYLLDIAKKASEIGGARLMTHYGKITEIKTKANNSDLVTNADIAAEKAIIEYLSTQTPNISILAEESGISIRNDSLTWCIDPLDGTTNYANGYPFFATSIGLTIDNKPILGSICVPFLKETYYAAPSLGAFCNKNIINVTKKSSLEESLLVTGFAYDKKETIDNNYAEFAWLTHMTRGVRRGGAAAVDLAFVASGRIDGYWERGLSKWDLAAGVVIVEMAGGVISNYPLGDFDLSTGRILATCPNIKKELIAELAKVKPLLKSFYCSNDD